MNHKERFFITTAISYPNGRPHIGHAYELIASDAIARFMRLDGKDVFFSHGHRRAWSKNAADVCQRRFDRAGLGRS